MTDHRLDRRPLSMLLLLATGVAASTLIGCASDSDGGPAAPPPSTAQQCVANPFGDRALYLRGGFNSWNAVEEQKLVYNCNRFELVTDIRGNYPFKVGDAAWSPDSDFGGELKGPDTPVALAPRGLNLNYTFSGEHRIVLDASKSKTNPTLTISNCPAPPLDRTVLFLRGSMNGGAPSDDYVLKYSCDAYYANVKLDGRQTFRIGDVDWTDVYSFGAPAAGGSLAAETPFALANDKTAGKTGDLSFDFKGEHTVRLAFQPDGTRPTLTIGRKTYVDNGVRIVTDPVALSVAFDSRATDSKRPFGAVTTGSRADFALTAKPGVERATLVIETRRLEGNQDRIEYTEVARVPLSKSAAGERERWSGAYTFAEPHVYGYYFELVIGGKTYLYQNNKDMVYWTLERGSNGLGLIDHKPENPARIRRYRQTVYSPDFKVPEYAKDMIYYYIFPDRFRNGDPGNDPNPAIDLYRDAPVEFHADWNARPFRPGAGDGSDNEYANDFFGGDLAGVIEKLDYLADLGVNTLYFNPLFKAASNHKYDTADYKTIDPHFGSNEDYVRLVNEAAKRGMRVIMDASLNHSGTDSVYFDRYSKYAEVGAFEGGKISAASPYSDWYLFRPEETAPNDQYQGWTGLPDLPEYNEASASYRDFAFGAPDSVTKFWLDRGIAGWRMDVAPWVGDEFWREWRKAVKGKDPEALTLAETWFDASKYFLGDEFDSTMNYILRNAVVDYSAGASAASLYHNIELMRENYPPQAFYALMNLLSSHDVARALHQFGYVDARTDPAKIAEAKQRLRLATLFIMIFPGAPSIYYGDEVGVTGGEDPYNRATYPWADRGGRPDAALLADTRKLIKMRRDHPVLRHGSIDAPLHLDANLIVLARRDGSTWAITATNNAATAKTVTVDLPHGAATRFSDALTGGSVNAENGRLTLTVPPLFGSVLISQ